MMRRTPHGFTLIEMSVVLSIIALVVSAGLAVLARNIEDAKIQTTTARMTFIIEAIERYVDKYNQIPCPARGSRAVSHANFGFGLGTGDVSCSDFNFASGSMVAGVVPVHTLMIDPIYMLDGWGRRITYVTSETITFPGTPGVNGYLYDARLGNIEIQNSAGNTVLGPGPAGAENAAVLLISHGKNGHGAWKLKGGTQIDLAGAEGDYETDNGPKAGMDTIFRLVPFRTLDGGTAATSYFDDILMYRTKWQLKE